LGQHTSQVLEDWLAMSDADVASLRQRSVV
jgi:crotonobetainyl-CoA:carnitine CoA-transferase CaiB-like acyl-CoA transferase